MKTRKAKTYKLKFRSKRVKMLIIEIEKRETHCNDVDYVKKALGNDCNWVRELSENL